MGETGRGGEDGVACEGEWGFVHVDEGGLVFSGDALVSLPPYLTAQGAAMLAWSGCGDGGKRTDGAEDVWFIFFRERAL